MRGEANTGGAADGLELAVMEAFGGEEMKLTVKFVLLIVFAIVAVIAWEGYSSVRREIRLFDNDMRRDARLLGRSLMVVLADVWKSKGMADALQDYRPRIHACLLPIQLRSIGFVILCAA